MKLKFLKEDIKDEKKGIKDYGHQASRVKGKLKPMLKGIQKDEKGHKKKLEHAIAPSEEKMEELIERKKKAKK